MSELSRLSAIRACLFDSSGDESDRNISDVDTDLDEIPESDEGLLDFSSGSGEEYSPNLDDNVYSESDDDVGVSNRPSTSGTRRPRPHSSTTFPSQHSQHISDSDIEDETP